MAFQQSDLDAIEQAIASGELRVRYGNPQREVEFRSMTELISARDMIRKSLGVTTGRSVKVWGYRR